MGGQGQDALKAHSNNTLGTSLLLACLPKSCPFLRFLTGFARISGSSDPKISKFHIGFYDASYGSLWWGLFQITQKRNSQNDQDCLGSKTGIVLKIIIFVSWLPMCCYHFYNLYIPHQSSTNFCKKAVFVFCVIKLMF